MTQSKAECPACFGGKRVAGAWQNGKRVIEKCRHCKGEGTV